MTTEQSKTARRSLDSAIAPLVADGQLAGAAALVWRDGEAVDTVTVGRRDLASGAPVERDTIFRIASMTKPVTTLAALSMLDEGRFALDDPIVGCAPEFARVRVLRDPEGAIDRCDSAARAITFRDLLTHRSGLTYGELGVRLLAQQARLAVKPREDGGIAGVAA
jgi:CubicO group peptidase (beta-lactamase class C family)